MTEFLVGLQYHYPKDYELWQRGIVEDYEASTGLFVSADDAEAALAWGHVVAEHLLNHVHKSDALTLQEFQHQCWLEADPATSSWSHCLGFFQHVAAGELPQLDQMTSDAYQRWLDSQ